MYVQWIAPRTDELRHVISHAMLSNNDYLSTGNLTIILLPQNTALEFMMAEQMANKINGLASRSLKNLTVGGDNFSACT